MKKLLISIIIVFCLSVQVWAGDFTLGSPAQVDPSNGVGADYTSLSAAEAAIPALDNVYIECYQSGVTVDTTAVTFSGVTGAVTVTGTDFPADGVYDNTQYILGAVNPILIQQANVNITNLQIDLTGATYGSSAIYLDILGVQWNNIIDSCIIRGTDCTANGINGVFINRSDAGSVVTVKNTVIDGFNNTGSSGLRAYNDADLTLYGDNCTIHDCTIGALRGTAGTMVLRNSALFGNTDDISGTISLSYCATVDGDDSGNNGNITITQTADDFAALVVDAAGGDFSLTDANSELYNAGADLSGSGVTDDIIGTARPQAGTYDIGAFEYVVAGGTVIPVIMHHRRR